MGDQEKFVDADTAAAYLEISRDFLLKLARDKQIPAYPLSNGNKSLRRTWRFKISQLNAFMETSHTSV